MASNRTIGIAAALGIAGAGALALLIALPEEAAVDASIVAATGPAIDLEWEHLVPGDDGFEAASGVVEHEQVADNGSPLQSDTDTSAVRAELDGKRVRIPGYMTPLDFENAEVSEFLLVPYVGACVHVPPPPANQIVYVTMAGTVPVLDMWEPLVAEGTLRTQAQSTELAEVGYTMQLSHLELYEPEEPDVFDDTNGAEPPALEGTDPLGMRDPAVVNEGTALEAVFRKANQG